jgi:hypothetical protein
VKRPVIAAVLLLSTGLSAHATYMYRYHDVRNKHQHLSDAAATQKCDPYHQQAYESREFNSCMRAQGWKFYRVDHIRDDPEPDSDSTPYQSNDSPSPIPMPDTTPVQPPPYEPPPTVDIHPFCADTIC